MKTILRLFMYIALLLPLMGCEHRELCYDHSHMTDLEVVFDWSKIPDADPRTMVVHFFRPDGSYFRRMDFVSREGGKMRIEAGEYMVLFHNGETDVVREKGTDFSIARTRYTVNKQKFLQHPMVKRISALAEDEQRS